MFPTGTFATPRSDLAPFLRRIVFLRQPHLGTGADGEGVRLGAVDLHHEGVEGAASWKRASLERD